MINADQLNAYPHPTCSLAEATAQSILDDICETILALDIGTSSCKAVLIDSFGRNLASAKGAYPVHYGDNGRVEQQPEEIWAGVCQAILGLHPLPEGAVISGISLSSQISSHFFIDHSCQPLTGIISWMDTRASEEAEQMKSKFSETRLFSLLGAQLPFGSSWPIPKIRWVGKHLPSVLRDAMYMIQPKEWVIWKFTSEWCSDLSSLRGLTHQQSGQPADELLDWAGFRSEQLPPYREPWEIAGYLQSDVARLLGLTAQIPVFTGWNDLNAALLGMTGLRGNDCGFDLTGTSEHIGLLRTGNSTYEQAIPGINMTAFGSDHHLLYGVTSSGGQSLRWYADRIANNDSGIPNRAGKPSKLTIQTILKESESVPAGANGLIFLPYLNGERSPWWNPQARGIFYGMHSSHNRYHLARAVVEGGCYALRTIMDRMPDSPEFIITSGGLSNYPSLNQLKADILGIPYIRLETAESGCLGAAILAAFGLHWYDTLQEAADSMIQRKDRFEPCSDHSQIYENRYDVFVRLYEALVPVYDYAAQQSKT